MTKEETMKLCFVEAWDHFGTNSDEPKEECIARFIGELVNENEVYLYLRHLYVYFPAPVTDPSPTQEIKGVLKSVILKRVDITFDKSEWPFMSGVGIQLHEGEKRHYHRFVLVEDTK